MRVKVGVTGWASVVMTSLAAVAMGAAAPHDLMPAPAGLEWGAGALTLGKRTTVSVEGACDARVDGAVERLGAALADAGVRLRVKRSSRPRNAPLSITCREAGLPVQAVGEDESYALTVTIQGARIEAATSLGALHGLTTLGQLVLREGGRIVLPAASIEDAPRFPWRGLLVDACRHWQPVSVIERTLDGMAAVKLNVLHWHLSEDQAFRVESRHFPRLHEMGSGGRYYTQEQVREVVAYARERGIRVVPEFDVPGHSTSWLVGYPELGSAPGPFQLIDRWGIFDNCLDPTRDEVYAFLDTFFGEMAGLFPDAHLHIGGDEVRPRQWNASPAIQEYAYRLDLRGAHGLQAHFNERLSAIVKRHGKTMVGWDEILADGLPRDTVIHSWRGTQALAAAAQKGFKGILSNGYYLDLYHPAAEHYLVDPLPAQTPLTPEERARVLGGEACMWSEFVTPELLDGRVWPRAAAIAERLWSPRDVRDVADMYRRLEIMSGRLDALGLTHQSGYEPMLVRLVGEEGAEALRVLADVVTPVKGYARGHMRVYTNVTPLDRLVDAVRPESDVARVFAAEVEAALNQGADATALAALRARLEAWRDNHERLEPFLQQSPKTVELLGLSRDLSEIASLGLEAVTAVGKGVGPAQGWTAEARQLLEDVAVPRAELELAILPAMTRLVDGAGRPAAGAAGGD